MSTDSFPTTRLFEIPPRSPPSESHSDIRTQLRSSSDVINASATNPGSIGSGSSSYLVWEAPRITQRGLASSSSPVSITSQNVTDLTVSLSKLSLTPPSSRTRNLIDCHYTALLRALQDSHQRGAYPYILTEVIRRSIWKQDRERFHSAIGVLQSLHLDDEVDWKPYIDTVVAICENETTTLLETPDYTDQDGTQIPVALVYSFGFLICCLLFIFFNMPGRHLPPPPHSN